MQLELPNMPYDTRGMLRNHLLRRTEAALDAGDRERGAIKTPAALRERQKFIHESFMKSINAITEKPVFTGNEVIDVIPKKGYRIEKIIFCPRKSVYATADMYIPDSASGKTPAVLFLCGHAQEGKTFSKYMNVCRELVSAGLIVFALDPTGQGERLNYFDPASGKAAVPPCVRDHDTAGLPGILAGRNIAAYFLHDAMCAVDYLCSRKEVDPDRIGVTGNSGGGTQTSMLMMADPRLAAAAPGTFIMDKRSMLRSGQAQDAEQIWWGTTALGIDHEDILVSMAPKPVMVLGVDGDFFPPEGTARTVERAGRIWKIAGAPDGLECCIDAGYHEYTPELARRSADFFSRRLLGRAYSGGLLEPADPAECICTASGQVNAEFPDAVQIFRENRELAEKRAVQRAETWYKNVIGCGRKKVAPFARPVRSRKSGETVCELWVWRTLEDLYGAGIRITPEGRTGPRPVKLALWPDGTKAINAHGDFIDRTLAEGADVFVVDLPGEGYLEPFPLCENASLYGEYGTLYTLCCDFLALGDSLPALRVFALERASEVVGEMPEYRGSLSVFAEGEYCLYVKTAAAGGWDRPAEYADERSFEEYLGKDTCDTGRIMLFAIPGIAGR